ncbi:MAG: DUF3604 domain-containing protein [Alphaproteobacteria bacterium]|nr:DUF3604 domain-containing protein [Alphaproteobacteria bacterium]
MPYSDYRPELMGSATLEPSGSVEAGSYQSFTLVYTAGRFGVDDTGSIKIGFRFATDFGPVQFDDPKAAGYTTVEASNGATLECRWEFKRNIRPWSRSLYIGVMKHFLKPGDTITIRFGDQRQGSPGIRMQTYCESDFEFRVLTDVIATYDYVALPESPKVAIVSGPGVTWQAVVPTLVRAGEPFALKIKSTDKWGNPSDKMTETLMLAGEGDGISGLPREVTCRKGEFSVVVDGLSLAEAGEAEIIVKGADGQVLCRSNPLRAIGDASDDALVHFWADTHGQSNETLGTNTAREYFLFGRDKAFLDVMGHQGNDFQITGRFWRHLNELTAEFDKPGEFVCIPGYEWSANTAVGGDRNVHYRNEGETIHRSSHAQIADPTDMVDEESDAHTAGELFEKLRGKDCVVAAHVGGRYADITFAHDDNLETAVEEHSAWGTFEWIVWDAFAKGFRVGIVGNSDGHKGRPGACFPGASFFGSQGGLTCYLAPRLDRDAIFAAMRRRRHYATTGNRMYLDVAVTTASDATVFLENPPGRGGATETTRRLMMGDVARVTDREAMLAVEVVGSAPIERLDVFRGRELMATVRPYSQDELGRRIRVTMEGAEYRGRARTTTWDGSLSIDGNRIERAEMFNNWNLDRGIRSASDEVIRWKAVTTGNTTGVDVWLGDASAGEIAIETPHVSARIPVDDIGMEDMVFDGGGLERMLKVYRLPDAPGEKRMRGEFTVPLLDEGDTPIFIRITQADGHKAWSTPVYLFR